ncbi:glycosyltransferase [Photobacterium phosphoreum]|uniref:glycosyltransferase n=2 Tax=Photobacterium phosphoreum TaxID=659 RepID=UPI0007F912A2|nr:glycosyltransferase [Photobacterium phosphoreum]OBU31402.1 hypothetical protein AYY24_19960 [Photobacterium phosphoreum]PSW32471.1 hypothetical protein CTM87_20195 [Photobacterium phosphoreum]
MNTLLFYGELLPKTIHGISISNYINLNILRESFETIVVEIDSSKDNISVYSKLRYSIFELFKVRNSIKNKSVNFFYASLPTSTLGVLRLLAVLLIVKKKSGVKVRSLLHIHRGDFNNKYANSFIFRCVIKAFISLGCEFILLAIKQKKEINEILNVKCHVLENAIIEDGEEQEKRKFNNENINILYLSNYIKSKGIIDLLSSFSDYESIGNKKITLNCYGSFLDENIKKNVKEFDKYISININCEVSNKDKNIAINNCDFMILPSKNEGQPLTIIEALSFGKPIFCTNVGYVSEMFPPNYPFVFDKLDISNLSKSFRIMQEMDSVEYNNISFLLKEKYNKSFSLMAHREKLMTIFYGNIL